MRYWIKITVRYASDEIKNDRDVVMEAIKENGFALAIASQEFRDNPEIVRVAVDQNESALLHASYVVKKLISKAEVRKSARLIGGGDRGKHRFISKLPLVLKINISTFLGNSTVHSKIDLE